LGDLGVDGKIREMGCLDGVWIGLRQDSPLGRFVDVVRSFGLLNSRELLDQLSDCELLKDSSPWS